MEFLKPFKDLTVKMSRSTCNTVSDTVPFFNIIIDHTEDTSDSVGADAVAQLGEAAKVAQEKMVQYYKKTNITMMLCMALDPRRKFHYFKKKSFPKKEVEATRKL